MKFFTISYDLVGENRSKDIQNLEKELTRIRAVKVLTNSWIIKTTEEDEPKEIVDYLKQKLIGKNDSLIVTYTAKVSWLNIDALDTYTVSV
jgi:hypothetical protein